MKGKTRCGWILGAGKRFFWTGIFWVSAVGLAEARPEGLRNAGSEASSEAESVVRSRTEAPDERRPRRKELREGEDSVFLNPRNRYLHRLSSGVRSGYVAPSNRFLAGENIYARPLNWSGSAHLKYSFQSKPGTWEDRVYGSVYQGIGVGCNHFRDRKEIGRPWSFYLLQGTRICSISPSVGVFYEWNLGLSTGWVPYDPEENSYNISIGSRVNAYLNVDFFLRWALSRRLDLEAGVALTHYSNGNTHIPNTGINMISGSLDLVYNFGRTERKYRRSQDIVVRRYPRHMAYEVMLFGSWKRGGVATPDLSQVFQTKKFMVAGLSFAPLYALSYRIRLGAEMDVVYDASCGVEYEAAGSELVYADPPANRQIRVGWGGRVDYVMPYFTVSACVGYDVLHAQEDDRAFYQSLNLKLDVARGFFLNVGYRLKNFHSPNFLMFGIGRRFNAYR